MSAFIGLVGFLLGTGDDQIRQNLWVEWLRRRDSRHARVEIQVLWVVIFPALQQEYIQKFTGYRWLVGTIGADLAENHYFRTIFPLIASMPLIRDSHHDGAD